MVGLIFIVFFFFSSRRRHTRLQGDWSSDVCSSDLDAVLAAYAPEIAKLKARGGYVTADVIDVTPATPNLETMLAKFSTEHFHDEDEVRFIIRGRGLFHIHPREGPVIAIEVEAGALIWGPRGDWPRV